MPGKMNNNRICKTELALYMLLTLYFAVILYLTLDLNEMAALFPSIVLYSAFALLIIQFVLYIRNRVPIRQENEQNVVVEKSLEQKKALHVIAWMVSYLLSLVLVGYTLTIPVFVAIFLKLIATYSWKKSMIISVGTFVCVYFIFSIGLKIPLYKGLLGLF